MKGQASRPGTAHYKIQASVPCIISVPCTHSHQWNRLMGGCWDPHGLCRLEMCQKEQTQRENESNRNFLYLSSHKFHNQNRHLWFWFLIYLFLNFGMTHMLFKCILKAVRVYKRLFIPQVHSAQYLRAWLPG